MGVFYFKYIYNIMGKFVITEEEKNYIKNLYEQIGVISSLGRASSSTPRFNLAKGSTGVAKRPPSLQDNPFDDATCYYNNVKNLVSHCKKNEYKFKPDDASRKITIQLHDNMSGISFGGAINTLKTIKDGTQFCKVSNGYQYDGEDLIKWFEDEISLQWDTIWFVLKPFSSSFGIWDECDKREHS